MSDFDRVEERREMNVWVDRDPAGEDPDPDRHLVEDAYDLRDPKHPAHHDVFADVWDARAGK